MLRVYRGWIFTAASTEEEAEAKKDRVCLRGTYRKVVEEIDHIEYKRARVKRRK